ncbi:hypothetical protein V1525DRAFT_458790 [Lipomyces kononenkoae]|uniref:Uncharacterized protein n=1 Tax=Lipomyces kononenkoae TaxID=34357 RepID=A0ACC3SUS1_LIPKO
MTIEKMFSALTHFRLQRETLTKNLVSSAYTASDSTSFKQDARSTSSHEKKQPKKFKINKHKNNFGNNNNNNRSTRPVTLPHGKDCRIKTFQLKKLQQQNSVHSATLDSVAESEESVTNDNILPALFAESPLTENNECESASGDDGAVASAFYSSLGGDTLDAWMLDSGATAHMTADITCFRTFKRWTRPANVTFAGKGMQGAVIGSGEVALRMSTVKNNPPSLLILKNVLHIPSLRQNLLSTYVLGQDGIEVRIHNGGFHLYRASNALAPVF